MHWFWRGTIAVIVGLVISALLNVLLVRLLSPSAFGHLSLQVPLNIARLAIPVLAYGWLTCRFAPTCFDSETRCRVCHYILAGINEPRCPECGERI